MIRDAADQPLIQAFGPARRLLFAQPTGAAGDAGHRGLILVIRREHTVQPRMSNGHVVGLEVIVHRDLPIDGPDLFADGFQGHHFLEPIGRKLLGQLTPDLRHGRRVAAQTDENETKRNIGPHRPKTMLGSIQSGEAFAHRHPNQAAVVPVSPPVVGAGDGCGAVSRSIHQARAAMAAHIVKGAYRAVAIAQHHDAFRAQIEGLEVARLGDGIDVAHDLPARQQNPLELEPGQFRMVIDPGRQGMPQLAQGLVGALRDGYVGHGVPLRRLYGHLMYAGDYGVGKSEQRSKHWLHANDHFAAAIVRFPGGLAWPNAPPPAHCLYGHIIFVDAADGECYGRARSYRIAINIRGTSWPEICPRETRIFNATSNACHSAWPPISATGARTAPSTSRAGRARASRISTATSTLITAWAMVRRSWVMPTPRSIKRRARACKWAACSRSPRNVNSPWPNAFQRWCPRPNSCVFPTRAPRR